jgi:hypothetical protein
LASFGSPDTGLPSVVVTGTTCRMESGAPGRARTRRISGSNWGTGNVRRFGPLSLICPFGPRSVTIQYSSGAAAG